MVEWSITAVLKTVELRGSGGSNPSLSAKMWLTGIRGPFFVKVTPEVTPFGDHQKNYVFELQAMESLQFR